VGYVQTEINQSEIESATTAAGNDNNQRREERASSKSNEIAGGDQYLRDGDYKAQEGQVAREEAEFV